MNAPSQSFELEHSFADSLEGLYAACTPPGFPAPELKLLNRPLAEQLGLDVGWLEAHAATVLSGSEVLPTSRPIAQAYAGHQFGNLNPQLGDGRALLLGELVDPRGRRFDLQLKGSGATPFSRRGDGKAALDSALREYIVSEAMHAMSVPTTRALAVVTTGETVYRERPKPGAVLTRVAASHLRVGTLEFLAIRSQDERLRGLVEYALQRHYPDRADTDNPAKALLDAVAVAQGKLVATWMLLGFVHGVMNTDNVTLSGETIDYGPCAFMETYDPQTVFSGIDRGGRYAFGNQPTIGAWNLARMAEAVLELISESKEAAVLEAQGSVDRYIATVRGTWAEGMCAKIGLPAQSEASGDEAAGDEAAEDDRDLVGGLLDFMHGYGADYTHTFRRLAQSLRDGTPAFEDPKFVEWDGRWRAALDGRDLEAVAADMDRVNPLYIPRNHKVQAAVDAALGGDLAPAKTLIEVLAQPYTEQPGREDYALPAPEDFGPYQTHCNT